MHNIPLLPRCGKFHGKQDSSLYGQVVCVYIYIYIIYNTVYSPAPVSADERKRERSGAGAFLLRGSGERWAVSRCRHIDKHLPKNNRFNDSRLNYSLVEPSRSFSREKHCPGYGPGFDSFWVCVVLGAPPTRREPRGPRVRATGVHVFSFWWCARCPFMSLRVFKGIVPMKKFLRGQTDTQLTPYLLSCKTKQCIAPRPKTT